ncbi:MAG: aldo/keto reductase [Acidobacteria bacterium]|nr:aldo/keto reductase [Acidobacteriota bacterium]
MHTRHLGPFRVSAIGLGCMSMSQAYGTPDLAESERALHRALDVGYTFLDTASIYGVGHNEKLIGRVLREQRTSFVLASKCGIAVEPTTNARIADGRPVSIRRTCEQSLANLQTDVIDLYYLHRRDHAVPIEESVGALAELVTEGKIRTIGLSEVSSTTLRRAHATHPIAALQSEYSLWTREPEHRVLATCRELGVSFVPFSPLGRAFLCGTIRSAADLEGNDMRREMPRFVGDAFERNLALLDGFGALARKHGCTMAQLALAWVLAQDESIVPIPGTKHVAYIEENAGAADLVIPDDDLRHAGALINAETVTGDRYAPSQRISLDPE